MVAGTQAFGLRRLGLDDFEVGPVLVDTAGSLTTHALVTVPYTSSDNRSFNASHAASSLAPSTCKPETVIVSPFPLLLGNCESCAASRRR